MNKKQNLNKPSHWTTRSKLCFVAFLVLMSLSTLVGCGGGAAGGAVGADAAIPSDAIVAGVTGGDSSASVEIVNPLIPLSDLPEGSILTLSGSTD